MMAAIVAARAGAQVTILEHMDVLGKKLLATGNGKCNYTNRVQGPDKYYGENPAFVLPVFEQFGVEKTIALFEELGIYPKDKNGYLYPHSEQAASVQKVLCMELQRLQVRIVYSCGIRSIRKENGKFVFDTKEGRYTSDKCILATGGKTLRVSGSDGSGFLYLDTFRHHIIDIVPGLVGLQGKQSFFKEIAGIRAEIMLKLYIENAYITEEKGELQLTNYGISGIPIFQISRIANKALAAGKKVHVCIDYMPDMTEAMLFSKLKERFIQHGAGKNCEQALIGLFPEKLIPVLLSEAGIGKKLSAAITEKQLSQLVQQIQQFRVDITDWNKFDSAQISAGGVDTTEVDSDTLESKLESGLYFAGEMLDIDGICGGYNLQWAWSSGYVAGHHAAKVHTTEAHKSGVHTSAERERA